MKKYKNNYGFTLIELLVVIAIIAILSVGGLSVYGSQMQKARDSNRITNITELQSAVEQFNQERGSYPVKGDDWTSTSQTSASVATFMPNLAQDPSHLSNCLQSTCVYVYKVQDTVGKVTNGAYELSTAFQYPGNIDAQANNAKDGGDDPNRLEKGFEVNKVDTKIALGKTPSTTIPNGPKVKIAIYRNQTTGAPVVTTIQ